MGELPANKTKIRRARVDRPFDLPSNFVHQQHLLLSHNRRKLIDRRIPTYNRIRSFFDHLYQFIDSKWFLKKTRISIFLDTHLQKPFRVDELIQVIKETSDSVVSGNAKFL